MRKSTVIALALIALGLVIGAVGLFALGFDFGNLDNRTYEEKSVGIEGDFEKITIAADVDDVTVAFAEDGKGRVEYCDWDKVKHKVTAKDGKIEIELEDSRRWYDYVFPFNFNSRDTDIVVYLPEAEYASLSVKVGTGDVNVSDKLTFGEAEVKTSTGGVSWGASLWGELSVTASTGRVDVSKISAKNVKIATSTGDVSVNYAKISGELSVACSTGRISVSDTECAKFAAQTSTGDITLDSAEIGEGVNIKADTGDVLLRKTVAKGDFEIQTDTGEVTLDRADAKNLNIVTDTGDVTGSILTEKIFYSKTSTGNIEVPRGTSGGLCEITTSTGDIEIEIAD